MGAEARLPLLLAVLVAVGCAPSQDPLPERWGTSTEQLEPVPEPPVEDMDPAVRDQLHEARAEVEELLAAAERDDARLAVAYGRLGLAFHAYDLTTLAAACYRNAERLAPGEPRWPHLLGVVAAEAGDFAAAVGYFERVLELDPGYLPAAVHLGRAWLARGEAEPARSAFARAAGRPDLRAAVEAGLGRAARLAGDLPAAARHLEAALEAQPEAVRLHHQLMLVYRDLGDEARAREHATRAGLAEPAFPDPRLSEVRQEALGPEFYLRSAGKALVQGRLEVALQEYRRALDLAPESARAHQGLASALLRAGELEGALEHFREAVRLEPESALNQYNLGVVLRRTGSGGEAEGRFRRALELDPGFKQARLHLASLALEAGRAEEALRGYDRSLEADPHDRRALAERPVALWRLGRREEALAGLQGVLATDPGNSRARLNLGALLVEAGELAEADRQLAAVLGEDLEEDLLSRAHFNRALVAERRGAPELARGHYQRAVELDPTRTEARFELAGALAREGRYGEAAEHYGRVVEAWPDHAGARLAEGTALVLAERHGEARRRFEAALERFPEERRLLLALATLLAASPDPEVRDGRRALELARAVHRASPGVDSAEALAMAHAELGRFEEAVEQQRRALEGARAAGLEPLMPRLERWLAAYRRGEPCREPWKQLP